MVIWVIKGTQLAIRIRDYSVKICSVFVGKKNIAELPRNNSNEVAISDRQSMRPAANSNYSIIIYKFLWKGKEWKGDW